MNLKVHSIDGKGKLENEVIWVDVVEAVDEVFRFFPISYHRVYVACCYFWPPIGQLSD